MVFSTIIFLFRFLPITLALYYLAPAKLKNTVLFLCSLVFYCWGEVRFFPVMVALILINYLSGLAIEHFDAKPALRRFFLLVALIGSLGMLFYFKYANFVLRSVNALLGTAFAEIQGIGTLPLGISFYTFQTLSYSIDVYRRDVKAERNIIDFGAYVVMFPQLIAGPIVKYRDVSDQLHVYKHRYNLKQIEGIDDISYGYYETTRSFTWDNMNINITTNGVGSETEGGSSENRKYMFAGEYVDIDKEIFDILNEYAGGKLDFNALKEGTQSVVFLDADNDGEYDDTMKDGVTLNLNNYYMGNPFYNIKSFYMDKYTVACNKFFTDLISEYRYRIDSKDMYEYISDNISREQIIETIDEYLRHTYDDPTDYYNMYLNTEDFDQD